MKFYTSYYENFKFIPSTTLCIGMSEVIPEDFRTTEINNFLYCPDNLMSASEKDIADLREKKIDMNEFAVRYLSRLARNVKKLGFRNLKEYFTRFPEILSSNQGFDSVCLLTEKDTDAVCNVNYIFSEIANKLGGVKMTDYFSDRAQTAVHSHAGKKQPPQGKVQASVALF